MRLLENCLRGSGDGGSPGVVVTPYGRERMHAYALASELDLRQKRTFVETDSDGLSLFEEPRPVIKSRRYPSRRARGGGRP